MSNKRIDLKKKWKYVDELIDLHDELGYAFVAQEHLDAPNHIVDLINELEKCYLVIDILQDTEDFDTQVAFHKEGLCKYLKYPCGPCESQEEE